MNLLQIGNLPKGKKDEDVRRGKPIEQPSQPKGKM